MKSRKLYRNARNKTNRIRLNRTRNRTMKLPQCSPKTKEKVTGFSCYTFDDLGYLKKMWNAKHQDKLIQTNNPKQIHALLTKYNAAACSTSTNGLKGTGRGTDKESCWLKQPFVKESVAKQIREFAFAPEAPKEWNQNPNEWLSSLEIENVMKQYEKAYKCFKFIGPSPIDFDKRIGGATNTCVWNELCNFSIEKLMKEGKNKIGIIFNTDTHDKGGQHWISMFINIRKGLIYFFDSVGAAAPPEVMTLVNRIKEQGVRLSKSIHFKFDQNHPVEHQYGNTECGIYSLFFIVHMLEDKLTSNYLKHHILKDKYMQKFRKIYFNETL